ncbi:hypothetical protein [Paraburkholderia sp. J8-2]|uniref:hypothetical protein n=1 Tax=Paraburkholderia sp. J8-2 TaxID=2805440 RepID=UPI002AB64F5A|nr:hypothetical protein [Paraburkholderia sp. J8-2]
MLSTGHARAARSSLQGSAAGAAAATDRLNVALIVLCCLCAHLFPYQTLVGSYAILGPAHYLTEISWLHDRRYFARRRGVLPTMALLALILGLTTVGVVGHQPWYGAAVVLLALVVAAALAISMTAAATLLFGGVAMLALPGVQSHAAAVLLAMLVPTFIHVFFLTAAFMLHGARRRKSAAGITSVIVLFAAGASFLLPFVPVAADPAGAGIAGFEAFRPVVELLNVSGTSVARITGLVGFAYLFHYVEWGAKVAVIGWARVPVARMAAMALVWVAVMACYAADFRAGFLLSLYLSQLHVLLEFPLNLKTISGLAAWTGAGSNADRPTAHSSAASEN